MGAPNNEQGSRANERPQHQVTIQPFFLSKYKEGFMSNTYSQFPIRPTIQPPVQQVSQLGNSDLR